MGVTVRSALVPDGLWGFYDRRYRLVTIKSTLGPIQYLSTLAHELGHAYYGHSGHHPKNESKADKWAARQLLTFDQVLDCARTTLSASQIALNLNVMPWVVEAFVNTLDADQVVSMMNQVSEHHA